MSIIRRNIAVDALDLAGFDELGLQGTRDIRFAEENFSTVSAERKAEVNAAFQKRFMILGHFFSQAEITKAIEESEKQKVYDSYGVDSLRAKPSLLTKAQEVSQVERAKYLKALKYINDVIDINPQKAVVHADTIEIAKALIKNKEFSDSIKPLGMGCQGMAELIIAPNGKYYVKKTSNKKSEAEKEAKILSQLDHENIVKLVHYNENELLLEYVDGCTLKDENENLYELQQKIATALQYLHSQRIMHRDIKPANILLTKDGIIKLIDFGLSEDENADVRSMSGSPLYISPDVFISGSRAAPSQTTKVDMWSLGIMLYHLGTGKSPYPKQCQNIATIAMHLYRTKNQELPLADLSNLQEPRARQAIAKLLMKNPQERPSATDLLKGAHEAEALFSPIDANLG